MHRNPILKWIIALSIMVVLNLLFNYSLDTIFDEPQYDEICVRSEIRVEQPEKINYEEIEKCQEEWESIRGDFEKKVFISLILLGVLTIIVSVVVKNHIVSLGLGLGAFLDFIVASMRYWRYSEDYLRILILVIALTVLIWLAIKKFGDK